MSATTSTLQRWDRIEYGNVVSTRFGDGILEVAFEDGAKISIPVEELQDERLSFPNWSAVSPGPFWITVPTETGSTEISWVTLRLLTDPEFEAFWTREAEERARRIGDRIRAMRQSQHWSLNDLALQTGLSMHAIEKIETGQEHVGLHLLERICIALGRTLADLSELPESPSRD
jgi:DNA-binding Xre family transcriptional regulator